MGDRFYSLFHRMDDSNPKVFENDGLPQGEVLDREMAVKS